MNYLFLMNYCFDMIRKILKQFGSSEIVYIALIYKHKKNNFIR